MEWIERVVRRAENLMADYRVAKRELRTAKKKIKGCRQHLIDARAAQALIQDAAQQVQQEAHSRIAEIVTKCLKAVFPDPYTFHIVFEKKRGKTEAVLEFRRRGLRLKPQDGVGGSVLDVAAFALRLACLQLQRPKRRKLVFVDEGFRGVSKRQDNKKRTRRMLLTLAKELGYQFVLITHDKGLQAGKVIEVKGQTHEPAGRSRRASGSGKPRRSRSLTGS